MTEYNRNMDEKAHQCYCVVYLTPNPAEGYYELNPALLTVSLSLIPFVCNIVFRGLTHYFLIFFCMGL